MGAVLSSPVVLFLFVCLLGLSQALSLEYDYALLVAEDARGDTAALIEALENTDSNIKRQAVRALGRFERPALASHVAPLLDSSEPELRIEAANALAQMGVSRYFQEALTAETTPQVRAVLLASLGRSADSPSVAPTLAAGLAPDKGDVEQEGAVRGLEHLVRRFPDLSFSERTIDALRNAVVSSPGARTRRLALDALVRASGADTETLERALDDPDPQVRGLAVRELRRLALEDPSHIVRYASLEAAFTCGVAEQSFDDSSGHVVLRAIDMMADGCDPQTLVSLSIDDGDWRRGAHALVTLARIAPSEARRRLPHFAKHDAWQARAYAARAAAILEDEETLTALRGDEHPNVVAETLHSEEDALGALRRHIDYGLLMQALGRLEGWSPTGESAQVVLEKLRAVTSRGHETSRDPRRLMLDRLSEWSDRALVPALEPYLNDLDPAIARKAAELIQARTGRAVSPKTTRFETKPPPPEERLLRHGIHRARIQMREAGPFTVELLPEEAPFTVAQFVALAERGYYDGLTFHRVVPNFVIQGGSPGANEYEGFPDYIRDEVGLVPHERGTLGISTRGRDTGDSQIFVNLVDNPRLDHAYTVFARVVEGMENVDRILEGDVMESMTLMR
jgi:cyclophilin family peptidyl-prolyl cis-trans isomerase/HEAT repeat protein